MYLDTKRILYVVAALILGLMGWWFVEMKNSATEEMIREMETAESFFRQVPYSFGNSWSNRFQGDRESIESSRSRIFRSPTGLNALPPKAISPLL